MPAGVSLMRVHSFWLQEDKANGGNDEKQDECQMKKKQVL